MKNKTFLILGIILLLIISSVSAITVGLGGIKYNLPIVKTDILNGNTQVIIDKVDSSVTTNMFLDNVARVQTDLNAYHKELDNVLAQYMFFSGDVNFLKEDVAKLKQESLLHQEQINNLNNEINKIKEENIVLKEQLCSFNKDYKFCLGDKI